MAIRTKGEQKAYLDGYEMCAECIEKYLSAEGKKQLDCLLSAVRNAVEIEDISALSENKGEDRPKGHWIESGYVGNDNYLFECSECHHTDTQSKAVKVNYCWHCGADMRGVKHE